MLQEISQRINDTCDGKDTIVDSAMGVDLEYLRRNALEYLTRRRHEIHDLVEID